MARQERHVTVAQLATMTGAKITHDGDRRLLKPVTVETVKPALISSAHRVINGKWVAHVSHVMTVTV